MADYLKTLKNPLQISEANLLILLKDFEQLNSIASSFPEKILAYVIDKEGEEILHELSCQKGCGKALKLGVCDLFSFASEPPRKKFFKKIDIKYTEIYLRLAKIYEASSKMDTPSLQWPLPPWLEIFLREMTLYSAFYFSPSGHKESTDINIIEEMLRMEGYPEDLLIRKALLFNINDWQERSLMEVIVRFKGFKDSALKHKEIIMESLNRKDSSAVIIALETMRKGKIPPEPFIERIAELAISPTKSVRKGAEESLSGVIEKLIPILKSKAVNGSSEERFNAVKLLWRKVGEKEKEFLEELKKTEKSKKVLEAIEEILSLQPVSSIDSIALEPPEEININVPLPEELLEALHKLYELYFNKTNEDYEKRKKQYPQYCGNPPKKIKEEDIKRGFELIQNMVIDEKMKKDKIFQRVNLQGIWNKSVIDETKKFLERPALELIHMVRFMVLTGIIQLTNENYLSWNFEEFIKHYRKTHENKFGLRELAHVFRSTGINPKSLGNDIIKCNYSNNKFKWEDEKVWPYFWEHIDIIEEVMGLKKDYDHYSKNQHRRNAYKILQMFPQVPPSLVNKLLEIAFGSPKNERPLAQKCLEKLPDIKKRIIDNLSSGKEEVRAIAGEWLGKMGDKDDIPIIEKALEKEKNDLPKAAFIIALENLGLPVEKFLNRKNLLWEAKKYIKSGIPKEIEWFAFDRLPEVHWNDTGETVEKDIIKYFVIKSWKMKNPEADPLLRRYCSYFKPLERDELGKFVLHSWITQDTLPMHTYDEASKLAEKEANMMAQWYKETPLEELYKRSLNAHLSKCKGSAIKEKGILAVTGACGGRDSIPAVEKYIKEWFGHRLHQCKALIQMLAWFEHPSAIQLLLSIGKRFRTKGIQEEANKYVNILAERKGWTIDELADRTIPTAGFDEKLEMELDYGERKFIVKLDKNLNITLSDEDGKVLKSLPAARKDDDEEKVKEAKKLFTGCKKELNAIMKLQKERLYEAMCTQRSWKFEDWNTYLNKHPLIRNYCQGLIWGVYEGERLIKTFRPLDDGSLTDYNDDEITVKPEEIIKLIHASIIDKDIEKKWLTHLSDYEITPPFGQMGKDCFILAEDKKEETHITEFEGHLLQAFTMRGLTSKAGYVRGQAEDGGWFYTYHKDFSGLGLKAIIEFSGNFLPEENRTVALRNLFFSRISSEQTYYYEPLSLGEIPPVMLSECWYDIKTMALAGTGYDKDWEKKVEY